MNLNPTHLLREATQRVPQTKYAFAVVSLAAVVAIIKGLNINIVKLPVVSMLAVLAFTILIFVFAKIVDIGTPETQKLGETLLRAVTWFAIITGLLLLTSIFFNFPKPITAYGIFEEQPASPLTENSSSPAYLPFLMFLFLGSVVLFIYALKDKFSFITKDRIITRKQPTSSELLYAHGQMIKLFGPDILAWNTFKKLHGKNKDTVWLISAEKKSAEKTHSEKIGFFEFFPLTKNAVLQIENGSKNGTNFDPADIRANAITCHCFYIGGIGAFSSTLLQRLNNAAVLQSFREYAMSVIDKKSITLYTRPVTKDGLRLVRNNDFEKLGTGEDTASIWKRELNKGEQL